MDIAERIQALRPNLLPNLHQGLKARGAGQLLGRIMPGGGNPAPASAPQGPIMSSLANGLQGGHLGFKALGPSGFRRDQGAGPVATDASGFRRPT